MIKSFLRKGIILCFSIVIIGILSLENQALAKTEKSEMELTFNVLLAKKNCQMAIWLVNERGDFVDTVYVTRKTAQKGLGNRGGGLDDKIGGSRLSVLPVWAHQRGVDYGDGNFYPSKDKPLPDAITSATPKAGEFVWTWRPRKDLRVGKYYYYIEVNKSFDDNEHHHYSWYRGQPAVVWRGSIIVGKHILKSEAKIIGHGDVAGKDEKIDSDLSTLTTALHLINKAVVIYKPGEK